jgi:uncharacterized protein (TIGR03435 family)
MGITRYFATLALLASSALGQSVLEVVSLRWHPSGGALGAIRMRPDGVAGDNVTLRQLIRFAYELQDAQILGPDWIATDGFDIEAKAEGRLPPAQVRTALQKLLVDRFKLRSHREKKELSGYRLVVAATGAKLRDPKEEESFNAALAGKSPFKEGFAGVFTNKDLPGFAERLSRGIGRIVVDDTGINGRYWFQLEWVPDKGQPGIDGPSLRAAIQEQVGLKLIEANVLAEALVIDSAERRP